MKPKVQLLVWGSLFVALVLVLGYQITHFGLAFFFVCMLLPVMVGTVYFFNQVLIPRYLLGGRPRIFVLYSLYAFIVSLWLQMLVIVFSFSLLANYQFRKAFPQVSDLFGYTALTYLLVFLGAFYQFYQRYQAHTKEVASLKEALSKQRVDAIELRVNRKLHRLAIADLVYIESMADYVQVHTRKGEVLITKEKISALAHRLPLVFIRIHRSFVVHSHHVSQYNRETVWMGPAELPISRTYKAAALAKLQSNSEQSGA